MPKLHRGYICMFIFSIFVSHHMYNHVHSEYQGSGKHDASRCCKNLVNTKQRKKKFDN